MLVLAIDPGAHAGWAIFVNGDLRECGLAKGKDDRKHVCERVQKINARFKNPLEVHVVAEDWPGRMKSWKSSVGLGKNWGRFVEALDIHLDFNEKKIERIATSTWRTELYTADDRSKVRQLRGKDRTEAWKQLSILYSGAANHNVAEAICIGMAYCKIKGLYA